MLKTGKKVYFNYALFIVITVTFLDGMEYKF